MLQQYLQKLAFTDKEVSIYLVLAELGVQPASVIARRCNMDRVTTYKHLKKLAERGFVQTYFRDSVQCFSIDNFEAIETYISEKISGYEAMKKQFPTAMNVLRSLKGDATSIPTLQMFEGEAGMQSLFRDMLHELKEQNIVQIRGLSANTFEEWVSDEQISKTTQAFFEDLNRRDVDMELFEATGGLVLEHVRKIHVEKIDLKHLPIARGTTSLFVVGSAVYMTSNRGGQVGLKMKQNEMSQIVHFLFDLLARTTEQGGSKEE